MGKAVIIPNISFNASGLGKVTRTNSGDLINYLSSISIVSQDSYAGTTISLDILYSPSNTIFKGVEYKTLGCQSIISGNKISIPLIYEGDFSIIATSLYDANITSTVKYNKTNYEGVISNNLLDPTSLIKNGYYQHSEDETKRGIWIDSTDGKYCSSDFIPCKSGEKYMQCAEDPDKKYSGIILHGCQYGGQVCYWKSDKTTCVASIDYNIYLDEYKQKPFVVPDNSEIAYFTISGRTNVREDYSYTKSRITKGDSIIQFDLFERGIKSNIVRVDK